MIDKKKENVKTRLRGIENRIRRTEIHKIEFLEDIVEKNEGKVILEEIMT